MSRSAGAVVSRPELREILKTWLGPHGFETDPQGMAHANFKGPVEGREVTVQAAVLTSRRGGHRRYFVGLHLDISVATPLMTRLFTQRRNAISGIVLGFADFFARERIGDLIVIIRIRERQHRSWRTNKAKAGSEIEIEH